MIKIMEKEVRGTVENQENRKLSYEELENIAHQLSAQAQQLNAKNKQLADIIEQTNIDNMLRRLDWLWSITTIENKYLTEEFRKKCGEEFMHLMAQPEPNTEEEGA